MSADGSEETLLLTPARHDTDGFFIAVMIEADMSCGGRAPHARQLA